MKLGTSKTYPIKDWAMKLHLFCCRTIHKLWFGLYKCRVTLNHVARNDRISTVSLYINLLLGEQIQDDGFKNWKVKNVI